MLMKLFATHCISVDCGNHRGKQKDIRFEAKAHSFADGAKFTSFKIVFNFG